MGNHQRNSMGIARAAIALAVAVVLSLAARPATSQCTERWLSGDSLGGFDKTVYATAMWDRDGDGPLPPRLIAGGTFTIAGDRAAARIAEWDGTGWRPLATSLNAGIGPLSGSVRALAVLSDNSLIVGGNFTTVDGIAVNNIARLDATGWSRVHNGVDGEVRSLTALPGGTCVLGGLFLNAGAIPARRVAILSGSSILAMGNGLNDEIYVTAVLPTGDVVAGGRFNGATTQGVYRWNGSTWAALNGLGSSGVINALLVRANGELVATGTFSSPAFGIARWTGTTWNSLGTNSSIVGAGYSLAEDPQGNLLLGGNFLLGVNVGHCVASWNGSSWSGVARAKFQTLEIVHSMQFGSSGELFAAGSFARVDLSVNALRIARFEQGTWSTVGGTGVDDAINATAVLPNGDLIVGGRFNRAGTIQASRVARRSGGQWQALGSGMNDQVFALAVMPNGHIVAGGNFTTAGGIAASRVAYWDGVQWNPLGTGVNDSVRALLVLPNGHIVAGGFFTFAGTRATARIAKWDGTTWSPLGGGITAGVFTPTVHALALMPNGDIVAGGAFIQADGVPASRIARWNGTAWSAMGQGVGGGNDPYIAALAVLPNGDLLAGGAFTSPRSIARWNGVAWSPLGTGVTSPVQGTISALAVARNGEIFAGGYFAEMDGMNVGSIARWSGGGWHALGTGVSGLVAALAVDSGGDLIACGIFQTAGPEISTFIARWSSRTGCPADFDCSLGAPTVQDLFDFLSAFFSADPSADFNGVGGVSVQDLFDFVNAYFSGCS